MARTSNGHRPIKTRAFVAAAQRIDIETRKRAKRQAAPPQAWQADAWDMFDDVPEVKETVWYLGNQIAKLRLFPAVDIDGVAVPVTDPDSGVASTVAATAVDELARLRSIKGGQADILRKLEQNFEIVGECYIVGWAARTVTGEEDDGTPYSVEIPEDWQVRSIEEVENKDGVFYVLEDPDTQSGQGRKVEPKQDTIIRVWLEHPKRQALADSMLRALINDCRTVSALTSQLYGESLSRHSAGILLLPAELSFGPSDETEDEEEGEAKRDEFQDAYDAATLDPITDPTSPNIAQPMTIRGPGELLDKVRHITFGRVTDAAIDARIQGRVERIARGLPVPVEKVLGHMQTTFANASQIDEDEFEDYLGPRADIIMDALTFSFLQPQLFDNPATRADAQRIFVSYDPSALIAQPDPEQSADEGARLGYIGGEAWRRVKGWTEDDAPDPAELLISLAVQRGILAPEVTLAMLNLLGEPLDVQPLPTTPGTPGASSGDQQAVDQQVQARLGRVLALIAATAPAPLPPGEPPGSPQGRPTEGAPYGPGGAPIQAQAALRAVPARRRTDAGARLAAIDRDLLARLMVASTAAMERALEKIGNVLRTKASAHRAITKGVPRSMVASVLGPTLVRAAAGEEGDLFADAWDELEAQFRTWGANAQTQALDIAAQVTSGFSTAERGIYEVRQAEDLDQAWRWMKDSLNVVGAERLFTPNPTDPGIGEFDPMAKVPTGLVRQAIQRAGGATGLTTQATNSGGHTVYVAITDAHGAPLGGIGTGELIMEGLADGGAGVEGYVWVYGPARRKTNFIPHMDLDGTQFVNFDDDVLANDAGFPEVDFFFPGDHDGCVCDFEPIIMSGTEVIDGGAPPAVDLEALLGPVATVTPEEQALEEELQQQGHEEALQHLVESTLVTEGTQTAEEAAGFARLPEIPLDAAGRSMVTEGDDLVIGGDTIVQNRAVSAPLPRLPDVEASVFDADITAMRTQAQAALNSLSDTDLDRLMTAGQSYTKYAEEVGYYHADPTLDMLYKERGFDALPRVVEPGEVSALEQDGWTKVYRGVSAEEEDALRFLDDLRGGDYFAGEGVFGNGTYSSTNILDAVDYARHGSEQFVATIGIAPNARYIEYGRLREVIQSLHAVLNKMETDGTVTERSAMLRLKNARLLSGDAGRMATLMGYDGITLETISSYRLGPPEYRVILNRAQLAIEKYDAAAWAAP